MGTPPDDRSVEHNRRAHDAIGAGYDAGHPEIFNATEQARIASTIRCVVDMARGPNGAAIHALDVGCGTGNLTSHLLAAGAHVTAADLSQKFIDLVSRRFTGPALRGTALLNGRDLRPIADGTFDLAVTYSVLHHVPDYLTLVREMARVTRPGGLVTIDHERSDASWTSADLAAFRKEAVVWPRRRWWRWLDPRRYWKRLRPRLEWRRWMNPRWMPEGDLHVWLDDHIEWTKIEQVLAEAGCDVTLREAYLLYEPRYAREAWERWRARASDMQVLVARKRR